MREEERAGDDSADRGGGFSLLIGPFLFLAVLVALAGIAYTFVTSASTPEIAVPEMTGKRFEAASAELKRLGLEVKIQPSSERESFAVGLVIRTSPSAGSRVKAGREILLVVAAENAMIPVPNLAGLSLIDAENRLSRAGINAGEGGLMLGKKTWQECDSPAGSILSQAPPADAMVRAGTAVDVVVAVAQAADSMPNLVGMMLPQALDLLAAKGCLADTIETYFTTAKPANMVLSQKPSPGAKLGPDVGVRLTVAVANAADMNAIAETTAARAAAKRAEKEAGTEAGSKP